MTPLATSEEQHSAEEVWEIGDLLINPHGSMLVLTPTGWRVGSPTGEWCPFEAISQPVTRLVRKES